MVTKICIICKRSFKVFGRGCSKSTVCKKIRCQEERKILSIKKYRASHDCKKYAHDDYIKNKEKIDKRHKLYDSQHKGGLLMPSDPLNLLDKQRLYLIDQINLHFQEVRKDEKLLLNYTLKIQKALRVFK